MAVALQIDQEALAEFCRRHQIVRLALFGSALRDDFGPHSDVDILVQFAPDAIVTLLDMARMEAELTRMVGRQVDLRTPDELSRYFRDQVLEDAVVQYAA